MADVYANFAALAADNVVGTDYQIESRPGVGQGYLTHIAVHGGGIEPPTAELARFCAGNGGSFYLFRAVRAAGADALHLSSARFDEPGARAVVAGSAFTVSWHGVAGTAPFTYVSGADISTARLVTEALAAAGFVVLAAPDPAAGADPANLCNRNRRGAGVELHLSLALRQSMYAGGDLSADRLLDAAARTQTFTAYANAVVGALVAATAPGGASGPAAGPWGRLPARGAGGAVQMAIPFALAADGSVAVTQDEAQALGERVRALVGTLPGERVMRADFGAATTEVLFAPDADLARAELEVIVRDAVQAWEPTAVITGITSVIDTDLGLVNVDVRVGRADIPQAQEPRFTTVAVRVGGSVVEVPQ